MRRRRRLSRILLNAVTAASLALCAAAISLWTMSERHACVLRCAGGGRGTALVRGETVTIYDPYLQPFLVQAERGRLSVRWEPDPVIVDRNTYWSFAFERGDDPLEIWIDPNARFPLGERWISWDTRTSRRAVEMSVPFWAIVILTLVLPAARVIRLRSNRPSGLCRVCGYDLRATPDRCPECGAVPPSALPPPPSA